MRNMLVQYRTVLGLLLCFSYLQTQAQFTRFQRNYLEPWEGIKLETPPVNEMFANEDAVILHDNSHWEIRDIQNTTLYSKYQQIKFLSQKGIEEFATITIPESIDPSREYSDLPIWKHEDTYRPKYFDLEIRYVHARIIKPDGKTKNVVPKNRFSQEHIELNTQQRFAYAYHFDFAQLEVGDVLEIEYLYFLPFVFDWRRIFFHSDLPKQNCELKISHAGRTLLMFDYANGAEPKDINKEKKRPYTNTYTWTFENLSGCINEIGARPHKDLPHITYYLHNKAYGDWKNEEIVNFKPYSWNYFAYNLVTLRQNNKVSALQLSPEEIALNKFYKTSVASVGEGKPLQNLMYLHEVLTEDFRYANKKGHYANTDKRISKLSDRYREKLVQEISHHSIYKGVFNRLSETLFADVNFQGHVGTTDAKLKKIPATLKNKILYNTNRDAIYRGIFNRLEEEYFQVSISDARVGAINPDICLPVLGDNQLFAIKYSEHLFYVYPKNTRFGYTINELPFYLEDANALHIHQMTKAHGLLNNVQLYKTPKSTAADNYRKSSVKAAIDLKQLTASLEAKVILSGQYATLLRGLYQYNAKDSTINQRYTHKINQPSSKTSSGKPKVTFNKQYPFKTDVRVNYRIPNLIQKGKNNTYAIKLAPLLKHIIYEKFNENNRTQTFYTDFVGRDTYHYLLSFKQAITIPDTYADLPIKIETALGEYHFVIEQMNDHGLRILSDFKVNAEQIAANEIDAVADIYKTIEKVEGSKIVVKLKE